MKLLTLDWFEQLEMETSAEVSCLYLRYANSYKHGLKPVKTLSGTIIIRRKIPCRGIGQWPMYCEACDPRCSRHETWWRVAYIHGSNELIEAIYAMHLNVAIIKPPFPTQIGVHVKLEPAHLLLDEEGTVFFERIAVVGRGHSVHRLIPYTE